MTTSSDGQTDSLEYIKVRAWSLVTEDHLTVRAAAAVLEISRSTVSRYVREIEAAGDYIDLLNVAEVRVGQAIRCDGYIRMLQHRVEKEGRPIEQILPHLLNVEKFVADLIGTKAPTRFQVEHHGNPPAAMDPRRAEAIAEAKRIIAADRAEREARGDDD
jgi:hypothetical protein